MSEEIYWSIHPAGSYSPIMVVKGTGEAVSRIVRDLEREADYHIAFGKSTRLISSPVLGFDSVDAFLAEKERRLDEAREKLAYADVANQILRRDI